MNSRASREIAGTTTSHGDLNTIRVELCETAGRCALQSDDLVADKIVSIGKVIRERHDRRSTSEKVLLVPATNSARGLLALLTEFVPVGVCGRGEVPAIARAPGNIRNHRA
jgi:hypothetical protein